MKVSLLLKQAVRVRIACRNGGGALRGEVVYPGLGEIPEYHLTGFLFDSKPTMLKRAANARR